MTVLDEEGTTVKAHGRGSHGKQMDVYLMAEVA